MKKLYIRPVRASNNGKTERWWAVQQKDEDGNFVTLTNGEFSHAYPKRELATEAKERLTKMSEVFPRCVYTHRYFDKQDYEHLSHKGYTDDDISAIWDRDMRNDIISNLLWLEANNPETVKEVLGEYKVLQKDNPYK